VKSAIVCGDHHVAKVVVGRKETGDTNDAMKISKHSHSTAFLGTVEILRHVTVVRRDDGVPKVVIRREEGAHSDDAG
jgi:hypothetical protein